MTTLNLGMAAGMSSALTSSIGCYGALRLQQVEELPGPRAHEILRAARLHVEANQGLGVRGAQIEAPVGKLEGQTVGAVARARLFRIARLHRRHRRCRIRYAVIELAAHRELRDALADQLRERLFGFADDLSDQEPRNHAAVAIGKTPEIMMRAHLPAVHPVDLAHALLDEGVTGFRQHALPALRRDDLLRVPGEAWVVHDAPARRLGAQQDRGQEPHDVVTLDETPKPVEEKAAVEIPIPGEAEIRAVRANRRDRGRTIVLEHGVRHAIRKPAIRLVVDLDELEGQVRLEAIQNRAGRAVARVHHDPQALQFVHIDIGEQVLDVRWNDVDAAAHTALSRIAKRAALGAGANLLKASVRADGFRLLAHEFHAVVVRRIVTGGHHDAAIVAAVEGREIDALGAAHTDVVDVHARIVKAPAQRSGETRTREPDVAPDHHALRRHELGIAASHAVGDVFVQLIGNSAAQVIGLEAADRAQVLVPWRP